jgi:hypothetical protein
MVFLLSFILFLLKIIGGSDGKLIILIFLIHPFQFLNLFFIISFFLWFSSSIILVFIQNFIINSLYKNNCSFSTFLNCNLKYSGIKKIYIKSVYKFINYSNLSEYKEDKSLLKSVLLIFNIRKNKFQVLVQYRPPLILIIVLTYIIAWLVILTIN